MSFLWLLIPRVSAAVSSSTLEERSVTLTTGVRIAWTQVFMNITGFLAATALGLCSLIFLIGAAQLTMARGDQGKVDNGKKAMIGALIGLAIIMGSYGILRTFIYFLYAGNA